MRRLLAVVALLVLPNLAVAETHQVTVNSSSFDPQTLVVVPGDTIVWTLAGSPFRSIESGSSCLADGVFFQGGVPNSGGCGKCPPQNPTFTWEVPEYAYLEIPYFSGALCDDGMTGLIVIDAGGDTIRVPEDFATIAEAIDAAQDGDLIDIASGVYQENVSMLGRQLTLRGEVNIDGSPAVTIDANGLEAALDLSTVIVPGPGSPSFTGQAVIENIVMTGGFNAGLTVHRASPVLRNCLIAGNGQGVSAVGAVEPGPSLGAQPQFLNCEIRDNSAEAVIGSMSWDPGVCDPVLSGCIVTNNGSGVVATEGTSATIIRSIICGNEGSQVEGNVTFDALSCATSLCQDDNGDGVPEFCFGDLDGILNVPSEYPTIQVAVNFAIDGQTVLIAPGTYIFNDMGEGPEPAPLIVIADKSITLAGVQNEDGSPAVTIQGDENDPPIGVMVQGGDGGLVTIQDLKIAGCVGGLILSGGNHVVNNCVLEGNSLFGLVADLAQVEVSHSKIQDGVLGLWTESSDVTLNACQIERNLGWFSTPGGILMEGGTLAINGCLLRDNVNGYGSASIVINAGAATIANSIVCGNATSGESGSQIEGTWSDEGGNAIQETCGSTISVPQDYPTLRSAVDAAQMFDTILISSGDYVVETTEEIQILNKSLVISGETHPDGTTAVSLLAKDGAGTFLVGSDGWMMSHEVVFENIEFNGFAFQIIGGRFTMEQCVVEGVSSDWPISGVETAMLMKDCVVRDNYGQYGSGVVVGNSSLVMEDCLVEGNTAASGYGGGSFRRCGVAGSGSCVISLDGCTVRNNTFGSCPPPGPLGCAPQLAGVSNIFGGELSLQDTVVCGNEGADGPTEQIFTYDGIFTDNGGNTISQSCPQDCPGDFDGNGVVGFSDLTTVISSWGDPYETSDLLLVLSKWDESCP